MGECRLWKSTVFQGGGGGVTDKLAQVNKLIPQLFAQASQESNVKLM